MGERAGVISELVDRRKGGRGCETDGLWAAVMLNAKCGG